jgi:ankyrin repeat protein
VAELENGVHPDSIIVDKELGTTLLFYAAAWGPHDLLEELLRHGASVNYRNNGGMTPLHLAAPAGRVRGVEILLAHDADPNARMANDDGPTPLHLVAGMFAMYPEERLTIAELLLRSGADATLKRRDGKTPGDIAREGGHERLLDLLRKYVDIPPSR